MILKGTVHDDVRAGTTGDDLFKLGQGGSDTATGDDGSDVFQMRGAMNSGDKIDGGTGSDQVVLSGDYSAGLTFAADTMVNVEILRLVHAFNYNLTMNDGNVAAGEWLTVDAAPVHAANHLTFDGALELDGHFTVFGSAGNDAITGGAQADVIYFGRGGNETVHGGGGDDNFEAGASLTSADTIEGGSGTDRLTLNGNYAAGVTFGAATMTNVETLRVYGNHNYNLTLNNANVAAGETLRVNAGPLGAGNHLTLNGAAETNGHFVFYGSGGDDILTGGSLGDSFYLGGGGVDTAHGGGGDDTFNLVSDFTSADAIDGGTGTGDTVTMNDTYTGGAALVCGAATMTNVELLYLVSGHAYDITTDNNTVANTATLTVNAATLATGENVTFNGAAETNGHFVINAGAGNDSLTGGAQSDSFDISTGGGDAVYGGGGNDTVFAGAEYNLGDGVEGNNGFDTLELAGVGTVTYSGANTLNLTSSYLDNFEQITVDGGGSYDIALNDNVASGSSFTINAGGLLAADFLIFDGSGESTTPFTVLGGAHFDASDRIIGGAAYDALVLHGDYTGANALRFGATTMTAFEQVTCLAGFSYDLTTDAATVSTGNYLYVDASALTAGQTLTFDGTATDDAAPGLNGIYVVVGGAGDDVITGGDANGLANSIDLTVGGDDTAIGGTGTDNFYMGGALTADDTIDGGAGYDQVLLSGDNSGANAVVFVPTTMVNVERITAYGNFSFDLTTDNATVASGESLAVDASTVGPGHSLTFNGSAETDGSFSILASGGNDYLTGGDQNDEFGMYFGGDDHVYGGAGDDALEFGAGGFVYDSVLTAADVVDGGTGYDTMTLGGDYTGANAVVFGATTMINVEQVNLVNGNGDFTTNNASVAAGQTLVFGSIEQLTFDGSAETDGHFDIYTGTGPDPLGTGALNDVLIGGALSDTFNIGDDIFSYPAGNDTITGGGGGDTIHASSNAADFDTFIYNGVTDSTSLGYDTITSMNFDNDFFKISGFATLPGAIDSAVTTGTLTAGSFDAQLAAAIGAAELGAHNAVLFTPSSGLTTHTFLIVDVNGTAGYQASQDLVFDVTGFIGTLTAGDFI